MASGFNPAATTKSGACGLMQLMPRTAKDMYVQDIWDPGQNINGGARYLRTLANQFEGDLVRTLAAYHAGPDAVRGAGGVPDTPETRDYVQKVLALYDQLKNQNAPGDTALLVHAQSDSDFFPMLKAGTRYDYKNGRLSSFSMEVTSSSDGEFRVRRVLKTANSVMGNIVSEGFYRRGKDGITSFMETITPVRGNVFLEPILRFPLKVGAKWTDPEGEFTYRVAARGLTVKVPAGEFKNCVRINAIYNRDGKRASSLWFAPGVGIVKDDLVWGDLVRITQPK